MQFETSAPVWYSLKDLKNPSQNDTPAFIEATVIQAIDNKKCQIRLLNQPSAQVLSALAERQGNSAKTQQSQASNQILGDLNTLIVDRSLLEHRYDKEDNDYSKVDDLVKLPCLNEPELLKAIGQRYMSDKIFSYVGPTLVVVNPYKKMDHLFSDSVQELFQEKVLQNGDIYSEQPHIFGIAAQCMQSIMQEKTYKQAIVISGESGAGKTENTKFAMKFLTQMNSNQTVQNPPQTNINMRESYYFRISYKQQQQQTVSIEQRILNCNPILEAFGNAKTTRNDNSSRFGKLVILNLKEDMSSMAQKQKQKKLIISSASLTNYLLEKSRIVQISPQERNYHIFYHLLKGADAQTLQQLGLSQDISSYRYLKSQCVDVNTISDEALYLEVNSSLEDLQFNSEEQKAIWNIVSTVLLLGNLDFENVLGGESLQISAKQKIIVETICKKLRCTEKDLTESLTTKKRSVNNQVMISSLKLEESIDNRDSFSKYLYEKLFNWIVFRLNQSIMDQDEFEQNTFSVLSPTQQIKRQSVSVKTLFSSSTSDQFINQNILSNLFLEGYYIKQIQKIMFYRFFIYFKTQNQSKVYSKYILLFYYNESSRKKDKQKYQIYLDLRYLRITVLNSYVLTLQMKNFNNYILAIYMRNLENYLTEIQYTDNKGIILTLDRQKDPIGIFNLVDDSSSLSTGTDQALIAKMRKEHEQNGQYISFPQTQKLNFTIHHSTGSIEYNVTNFRLKNKDEVSQMLQNLTQQKTIKSILQLGSDPNSQATTKVSDKFLGSKFRIQMKKLMEELGSCECQFVRCIKPNALKKAGLIQTRYALNQINCLGVLETIRVRKQGYVYRADYSRFYKDNWQLYPPNFSALNANVTNMFQKIIDYQDLVRKMIVLHIDPKQIQQNNVLFGSTMIFMKENVLMSINTKLLQINVQVKEGNKAYEESQKLFDWINTVAKMRQMRKAKEREAKQNGYAKKIQKFFRHILMKKRLKQIKAAVKIQNTYLSFKRREYFKNKLKTIKEFIKSKFLMLKQRKIFKSNLKDITFIQQWFKFYNSRKQRRMIDFVIKFLQKSQQLAWLKIRESSAIKIQSLVRMFLTKKHNIDIVLQARVAKNRILHRKAIFKIQKFWRYRQFKLSMKRYRNAAYKIQAFFKKKWCSDLYQSIKKNTVFIQQHVRQWLNQKYFLVEKWVKYDWESVKRDEMLNKQNLVLLGIPYNKQIVNNNKLGELKNKYTDQHTVENLKRTSKRIEYLKKNNGALNSLDNLAKLQIFKSKIKQQKSMVLSSARKSQQQSLQEFDDLDLETQLKLLKSSIKLGGDSEESPLPSRVRQINIKLDESVDLKGTKSQTNKQDLIERVVALDDSYSMPPSSTSTYYTVKEYYYDNLNLEKDHICYPMEQENKKKQIQDQLLAKRMSVDVIKLKAIILDLDQQPASHDIYTDEIWAESFTKIQEQLQKSKSTIMKIVVGEYFTSIIGDNSFCYTFGDTFINTTDPSANQKYILAPEKQDYNSPYQSISDLHNYFDQSPNKNQSNNNSFHSPLYLQQHNKSDYQQYSISPMNSNSTLSDDRVNSKTQNKNSISNQSQSQNINFFQNPNSFQSPNKNKIFSPINNNSQQYQSPNNDQQYDIRRNDQQNIPKNNINGDRVPTTLKTNPLFQSLTPQQQNQQQKIVLNTTSKSANSLYNSLRKKAGLLQSDQQNTDDNQSISNHNINIQSNYNSVSSLQSNQHQTVTQTTPQKQKGMKIQKYKVDNIKSIFKGDNQLFAQNQNKDMYIWGDNSEFQLPFFDDNYISQPTQISKEFSQQIVQIEQEQVSRQYIYLLTDGDILSYNVKHGYDFERIRFPTQIASVSCGGNFSIFLTSQGLLFSSGSNSSGELGHGDRIPRKNPQLINCFKKFGEKIKQVSCGLKHTLCLTNLGKIFTWGNNRFGQLGVGDKVLRTKPQLLFVKSKQVDTINSFIQVKAGLRSSIALTVDKHITWWGTNSCLDHQYTPIELNISLYKHDNVPKEFVPIKLMSSWCKNLSIFYVIVADLANSHSQNRNALLKQFLALSNKWEDLSVLPPSDKNIAKLAQIKSMK